MRSLFGVLVNETVDHPIFAVLIIAGVGVIVGALSGGRTYERVLREYDAAHPPVEQSNVRLLRPEQTP